jgi:anti-sigma-K factor RskA
MSAMTEQQAMAAIPTMSLAELRTAQSYPINSGVLRAIQAEVHDREASDRQKAFARLTTWRFVIATSIALLALLVAGVALSRT